MRRRKSKRPSGLNWSQSKAKGLAEGNPPRDGGGRGGDVIPGAFQRWTYGGGGAAAPPTAGFTDMVRDKRRRRTFKRADGSSQTGHKLLADDF
jgi:hypothetical protein